MLGIPARVGEGFTRGHAQRQPRHLQRHRPRRARLGRGVVPAVRLAAVRADPDARAAVRLLDDVEELLRRRRQVAAGVAGLRRGASSSSWRSWPARRSRVSRRPAGGGARTCARAAAAVGAVVGKDWHPGFISWILILAVVLVVLLFLVKRCAALRAVPAARPARHRRRRAPRPRGVRPRPGRARGRRDADAGRVRADAAPRVRRECGRLGAGCSRAPGTARATAARTTPRTGRGRRRGASRRTCASRSASPNAPAARSGFGLFSP